VFASRGWTKAALATNLAGTLLLFYSFQASSSSFRLITRTVDVQSHKSYEICVNDYMLLSTDTKGNMFLGHPGCPAAQDDRPAAVVNIEHPLFVTLGFALIVIGFIIQYFAVPEPASIAQLRKEIRLLKKRQRQERQ
jgi:hypothetical protein